MANLKNFEDLLKQCNNCDKNLLLGNGFSIAYDTQAFNYKNLIKKSKLPQKIKKIFEIFKTPDYELIINNLKSLAETFSNRNISNELINITRMIKRDLVRTVINEHPASQFDIDNHKKENTLCFLLCFNNIFTLNYDLLLYWIIMLFLDIKAGKVLSDLRLSDENIIDDGFQKNSNIDCLWTNCRQKQNIYYIHGALHLFYDMQNIYKIKYNTNENATLLSQIKKLCIKIYHP